MISHASVGRGRPAFRPLLAAAALLLGACASGPAPSDWLRAGDAPFRTPEGTLHAFRTAAAGDEADLGYRCLSRDFKRRNGLGQLAFRELADRYSWFPYLWRAEVVERQQPAEDRAVFTCEIAIAFKTVRFRIGFVREDFFDLYQEREPVGGDFRAFGDTVENDTRRGVAGVGAWVPLPAGLDAEDLTELRVGREWKIDAIELEPEDATPAP